MARTLRLIGTVTAFDDAAGWGAVKNEAGEEHWFHCTAIADGTRTIAEGADVSYELVAGRLGRWEATGLRPA